MAVGIHLVRVVSTIKLQNNLVKFTFRNRKYLNNATCIPIVNRVKHWYNQFVLEIHMKTKFLSLVSFFEKYLNCTSHTRAIPIKSAFIQNCWQSLLVFQCDRFFNRALKICSFTFPRSFNEHSWNLDILRTRLRAILNDFFR